MSKKKVITLLLTLAMILSLSVGVSAAETTEAKVPITLTAFMLHPSPPALAHGS